MEITVHVKRGFGYLTKLSVKMREQNHFVLVTKRFLVTTTRFVATKNFICWTQCVCCIENFFFVNNKDTFFFKALRVCLWATTMNRLGLLRTNMRVERTTLMGQRNVLGPLKVILNLKTSNFFNKKNGKISTILHKKHFKKSDSCLKIQEILPTTTRTNLDQIQASFFIQEKRDFQLEKNRTLDLGKENA